MAYFLPFNSVSGDRKNGADAFAEYFSNFISDGIFDNKYDGLKVQANGDMTVTVLAGAGFISGHAYISESRTDTVTVTAATAGGNPRIDRVVLRLSSGDRSMSIDIKTGTPAAVPVAPELTRDVNEWELCLAEIYVGRSVTALYQENITDTRMNSEVCGYCVGLIEQIDFNSISEQFVSWQDSQKEAFGTWVETIKEILDDSTAGNLQNQIDDLKAEETEIKSTLSEMDAKIPSLTWIKGGYKKGKGADNAITCGENVNEVSLLVQITGDYYVPITFPVTALANDAFIHLTNAWGTTGYVYYSIRRNSANGSITVYIVGADSNGKAVESPSWWVYYR